MKKIIYILSFLISFSIFGQGASAGIIASISQRDTSFRQHNSTDTLRIGVWKASMTAQGYGKYAKGGRGGLAYIVKNRDNSGASSFREGVRGSLTEPRYIIFDVGGYIDLSLPVSIAKDYGFVSILGQTAPGEGIALRGAGMGVHDEEVVMKHFKIAPGRDGYNPDVANRGQPDYEPPDAMQIVAFSSQYVNNVFLDRMTIKWGHDGLLDMGSSSSAYMTNVTISNSLFYENIDKQYGMLFDGNGTSGNVSFFNNVLWNNKERNVMVDIWDGKTEVVNNLFNYYSSAAQQLYESKIDWIGNRWYKIPGGQSNTTGTVRINTSGGGTRANTEVFFSDNTDTGNTLDTGTGSNSFDDFIQPQKINDSGLVPFPNSQVLTKVTAKVGTMFRDASDDRIISLVNSNNGSGALITHENQVGGYPAITNSDRPVGYDSDNDGVSDSWASDRGIADTRDLPDFFESSGEVWDNREYTGGSEVGNLYVGGTLTGQKILEWREIFWREQAGEFQELLDMITE